MKMIMFPGPHCFVQFSNDTNFAGKERPHVAISAADEGAFTDVVITPSEAKQLHAWLARWLKTNAGKR